jgi:hypothetical protein
VGGLWTAVGLAFVILGLLIASGAVLFSLWGREGLAAARARWRAPAGPSSENQAASGARAARLENGAAAEQEEADLLIGRTLLIAQRNADEIERAAHARAEQIVANAEASAKSLMESARVEASELLHAAREERDRLAATGREKAAAWAALVQVEADRMVLSAYGALRDAQRSIEQTVKAFPAELDRRLADWATSLPSPKDAAASVSGGVPADEPHPAGPDRSEAVLGAEPALSHPAPAREPAGAAEYAHNA